MNSLPTQVPRPPRRRAKTAAARAVKIEETHASTARQAGVEINLSNATETEIALARRLGEVRTRLASTQSELTELRTKLADAEASGADARALIAAETDTATLEDLEARIAEYKKQEAAHEEIEDKLRAQINELERRFADLSDTLRQSQDIETKLRAEVEELKARTASHEHTPSERYIAVGDHEAEMNTLRERAQELSDELERLRAEATERGSTNSSDVPSEEAEPLALLQVENERLAQELAAAQNERERTREQLDQYLIGTATGPDSHLQDLARPVDIDAVPTTGTTHEYSYDHLPTPRDADRHAIPPEQEAVTDAYKDQVAHLEAPSRAKVREAALNASSAVAAFIQSAPMPKNGTPEHLKYRGAFEGVVLRLEELELLGGGGLTSPVDTSPSNVTPALDSAPEAPTPIFTPAVEATAPPKLDFSAIISSLLKEDPKSTVALDALYTAYVTRCKESDIVPFPRNQFSAAIQAAGHTVKRGFLGAGEHVQKVALNTEGATSKEGSLADMEKFRKDKLEYREGSALTMTALYQAYLDWCKEANKTPVSTKEFDGQLLHVDKQIRATRIAGRTRYIGIAIKE